MLWDWSQRAAVATGQLDPSSTRRFLDRHTASAAPTWGPLMVQEPERVGNRTHRGVSERWLPLYVSAIFAWRNAQIDGRDPPTVALACALRSGRFPFRRLRPHLPCVQPADTWTTPRIAEHLRRWHLSVQATIGSALFERNVTTCVAATEVCAA